MGMAAIAVSENAPAPSRQRTRRYGEGSVYLRGRIWHIVYYSNGRKFEESSRSEDRREAERLLKRRLAEIRLGQFQEPHVARVTFDEIAEDVLAEYAALRRRTARDQEARIRLHLRPFFGGRRAKDISNTLAQEYLIRRRAEGAKDGTIWQELALLRHALLLAVENRKLREAPSIKLPRLNNVRRGFLESEQYRGLSEALPDYLKPIAAMGWYTGMREGEILSLRWSQLLLQGQVPHVRLHPGETKTGKGRLVPLAQELVELLDEEHRLHRRDGCQDGSHCSHFVFSRNGVPIRGFRKAWATACKQAGVPWLLFHDLRRSAVRNLVRAGVPETVAMAISGHRTRHIFDRYNIVSERDKAEAMERLQTYLEQEAPRTVGVGKLRALPAPTYTERAVLGACR